MHLSSTIHLLDRDTTSLGPPALLVVGLLEVARGAERLVRGAARRLAAAIGDGSYVVGLPDVALLAAADDATIPHLSDALPKLGRVEDLASAFSGKRPEAEKERMAVEAARRADAAVELEALAARLAAIPDAQRPRLSTA